MRVLITGGAGFVAPYVVAAIRATVGNDLGLHLTSQSGEGAVGHDKIHALDVTDAAVVDRTIELIRPTHVIHLAGISALPAVAAAPDLAWTVNVMGTLNLARSVLRHVPDAAFVFAGSSQAYGGTPSHGGPLREDDAFRPTSEYGATKAAADLALGVLALQGLRAIRLRLFNHTGPGQTETFALPSFAGQIVRIERGLQEPVIKVGNLDAERDLLDVRDVAEAYAAVLMRAPGIAPGTALNIASGRGTRMRTLLNGLIALARVPVTVEIDPARWRENEIPVLVGDPAAAEALLNWQPRIPISRTIADILDRQRRA
jgi:GDP-4-dehydro-6-deoxy-D-mannose reductase